MFISNEVNIDSSCGRYRVSPNYVSVSIVKLVKFEFMKFRITPNRRKSRINYHRRAVDDEYELLIQFELCANPSRTQGKE